ncbi:MAG: damage-inducible protein, partial [Alphaproteobacteria bacterium]|nr:damage-inducible protein [Alphaproteobacteria bacterium]
RQKLEANIHQTIALYNRELQRWQESNKSQKTDDFINFDPTKISWSDGLKNDFRRAKKIHIEDGEFILSTYRPFTRQWQYYSRRLNERVYQMPQIFPNAVAKNRVIAVTGVGGRSGFACLMVDCLPNLHTLDTGQCFPLKLYESRSRVARNMGDMFAFDDPMDAYTIKDGITDGGLKHFHDAYGTTTISKEDIFYYIYGLLHLSAYRAKYADNLSKELPRIPCIKTAEAFWQLSKAGHALAELHLNYEQIEPYPVTFQNGDPTTGQIDDPVTFYRVIKMRFGKDKDQSTIIYNDNITISDIPLAAYDYQVNGRSAIEWVMDRQLVKTDKASGIVNDANDYANDTMHNPAYPLELLQKVITLSLKTNEYIAQMPELD